jgi:hypothetical protein
VVLEEAQDAPAAAPAGVPRRGHHLRHRDGPGHVLDDALLLPRRQDAERGQVQVEAAGLEQCVHEPHELQHQLILPQVFPHLEDEHLGTRGRRCFFRRLERRGLSCSCC